MAVDLSQVAVPFESYVKLCTKPNDNASSPRERIRDLRVVLRMLANASNRPELCGTGSTGSIGVLLSNASTDLTVHTALFKSDPSSNAITINAKDNVLVPQPADTVTMLPVRTLRRVTALKYEASFVVPPDPCKPVPVSTVLTVGFAAPVEQARITLSIVDGDIEQRKIKCILEGNNGSRTVIVGTLPPAMAPILNRLFAPMSIYTNPDLTRLSTRPTKRPSKATSQTWSLDIINEAFLGSIAEEVFRLHVLAVAATADNTTRVFSLSHANLSRIPPSAKGHPACYGINAYVHAITGKCICKAHGCKPTSKPLGVELRMRFCGHTVDATTKQCPIHKKDTHTSSRFPQLCVCNPTAHVVCKHEKFEGVYIGLDLKGWPLVVDAIAGMRLYCSECSVDPTTKTAASSSSTSSPAAAAADTSNERRSQISSTIIDIMQDLKNVRTERGVAGDRADEHDRRCVQALRSNGAIQTYSKKRLRVLDPETGHQLKKCQQFPPEIWGRLLPYRSTD